MELTQESRELIDKALYRRKLFRWRVKSIGLLSIGLLFVPAYTLLQRVSTHINAASRLETLGGRSRFDFDSDWWTMRGTTTVWFAPSGFIARARGPITELDALRDLQNLTSLDLTGLSREELHDFDFLKPLARLETLRCDRMTPPYQGGPIPQPSSNEILKPLMNLYGLRYVQVPGNRITDSGLAKLSTLKKLEDLDLSGTLVTDAGLKHLIPMKSLRSVLLSQSRVTSAGVQSLQVARPDLQIEFDPTLKPLHSD